MFEKIQAAKKRLQDYVHITPILTSHTVNEWVGGDIYFKCENFQKMGAFKFRGAFNALSQLSNADRERGVIAYSSGNHAQAVAMAGRMLNIRTVIVIAHNIPTIKQKAIASYGAEIIRFDPEQITREVVAEKLRQQYGYVLIPPFDHKDIIAGQGTATLEMFEELGSLDTLLVPCGGGGLLSGSAVAAKGISPNCQVIGVEPKGADDAARSFQSKTLQRVENPQTIADGTRTPSLGNITFPLILEHVDDIKTVSEEAIKEAVKFLFCRMKLVVEPSGVLGLAALLEKSVFPNGRTGVILSGGNMDPVIMSDILKEP